MTPIEPAVRPAHGDVGGVRANQGVSDSRARLESDREGPSAERHDSGSMQKNAAKYKRVRIYFTFFDTSFARFTTTRISGGAGFFAIATSIRPSAPGSNTKL